MATFRSHSLATVACALALVASPPTATSQTFTKITDPTNPLVSDPAPSGAGFPGPSWIDADGDGLADLYLGNQGLYRNLGGGAFTRCPASRGSRHLRRRAVVPDHGLSL